MKRKQILISTIIVLSFVVLGWITYLRVVKGLPWADWTGFGEYTGTLPKENRAKTLWDILDLFIVPILLALGAYWLNRQQKKRELEIESDRQKEEMLQNYLASMSTLLIDKKLKKSKENDVIRDVARSLTLTTLRILESTRKGLLVRFLYEADLIKSNPFISLLGADLKGAYLDDANLSEINLHAANLNLAYLRQTRLDQSILVEANLVQANMSRALLINSHLYKANLIGANLDDAILIGADLSQALLCGANLSGADLRHANLIGADLNGRSLSHGKIEWSILKKGNLIDPALVDAPDISGIDLHKANLSKANLSGANLMWVDLTSVDLRGAKFNNETIWPDGFNPNSAGAVLVNDDDDLGNG